MSIFDELLKIWEAPRCPICAYEMIQSSGGKWNPMMGLDANPSMANVLRALGLTASPDWIRQVQQHAANQTYGGPGGFQLGWARTPEEQQRAYQALSAFAMPAADIIPFPAGGKAGKELSDVLGSYGILPDSARPEWMNTWPSNLRDRVYEESTIPDKLGYPHLAEQGKRLAERIHGLLPQAMKDPNVYQQIVTEADRYSQQLSKIPNLDKWSSLFDDPATTPVMRNWYSDYPE
jgi:hypothetical protein